jgi:hypothetical protein
MQLYDPHGGRIEWRTFMRAVLPDQCPRQGPEVTVEEMERIQVQRNLFFA